MSATDSTDTKRAPRSRRTAAMDTLLTQNVSGGRATRFGRPGPILRTAAGLARRPRTTARRVGGLGVELTQVLAGTSELSPAKGDGRFRDRAWSENWALRRVLQTYLALGGTVDDLIEDAGLDWRTERQIRFMAENVHDLLSPTNLPLLNPEVLKETIDRGGANLVLGARRFVRDIAKAPRLPATVDTTKFEIGRNIARTPGSVVLRTDVMELIEYAPQTDEVFERPMLVVPPTINKYYVLDLAEDRSFVEHLVQAGHRVFMISWRNPDKEHSHFDLDTYASAVVEAREAVSAIAESDAVNVLAACSGGIITAATLAHLAATGREDLVSSLTLMVCALDHRQAGTTAALVGREIAAAAVADSARRGYLDGASLAGVFAWLRPNDLIWRYVVNNYFLGKAPPAFDVLFWNQDTVRLSHGLHRDFVQMAMLNDLIQPGQRTVLETPVDLRQVKQDSYVVAGSTDHIVPWENAYRSTQVLGGTPRFVLSTSGHIQALVNPPSPESRSSFRVADEHPGDPSEWEEAAAIRKGSWWTDHEAWLAERSGDRVPAPEAPGSDEHPTLAQAPGDYVLGS
ncbi:alpha/beta hydrolase [Patulibacter sp.]|uniref:PHA/PHB synthase family protein n=1 Tax=Patulibacter sp. TaxID=1912859 RepID=UPI002723B0E3|nr:alpha/beta fold hydrolase [Patulibacter sp.]MDO9408025.1 alpha/beta fold hydrolase [Patulibacter sp.]